MIYSALGSNLYKKKVAILDVVANSAKLCQTVAYPSELSDKTTVNEEYISDFVPNTVIEENVPEVNKIDPILPTGQLLK